MVKIGDGMQGPRDAGPRSVVVAGKTLNYFPLGKKPVLLTYAWEDSHEMVAKYFLAERSLIKI